MLKSSSSSGITKDYKKKIITFYGLIMSGANIEFLNFISVIEKDMKKDSDKTITIGFISCPGGNAGAAKSIIRKIMERIKEGWKFITRAENSISSAALWIWLAGSKRILIGEVDIIGHGIVGSISHAGPEELKKKAEVLEKQQEDLINLLFKCGEGRESKEELYRLLSHDPSRIEEEMKKKLADEINK